MAPGSPTTPSDQADPGQPRPPLVFVTLGTDHHPFHRLLRWVDAWLATVATPVRCLVQTGESETAMDAEHVPYLPYQEMERVLTEADMVVTHAGSGSVIMCRRLGWRPIAVARRSDLGEHVDDHQVEFARRMSKEGHIELAEDEPAFRRLLDDSLSGRISLRDEGDQAGALEVVRRFGEVVEGLLRDRPPRRGRTRAPGPGRG